MKNTEMVVPDNGIIFIYISVSILVALILSSLFFNEDGQLPFSVLTWLGSFLGFFILFKTKITASIVNIKKRMKTSIKWPISAKMINGLCWAGPFIFGIFIPSIYEFLILLAVGLGNISTFLIFLKYNRLKNLDQLMVGVICILSIFILLILYQYHFVEKTQGEYLARFFVSVAFGIGGIYSVIHSDKNV